jgi:hypothetical protein
MDPKTREAMTLFSHAVHDRIRLTDEQKEKLFAWQLVTLALNDKIRLSKHDRSRLSNQQRMTLQAGGKLQDN